MSIGVSSPYSCLKVLRMAASLPYVLSVVGLRSGKPETQQQTFPCG